MIPTTVSEEGSGAEEEGGGAEEALGASAELTAMDAMLGRAQRGIRDDMHRVFSAAKIVHCPGSALYRRAADAFLALCAWDARQGRVVYSQARLWFATIAAALSDSGLETFRMLCILTRFPAAAAPTTHDAAEATAVLPMLEGILQHYAPGLWERLCAEQSAAERSHTVLMLQSWVSSLFAHVLPLPVALRVWDGWLLFGSLYLYAAVGVVIRTLAEEGRLAEPGSLDPRTVLNVTVSRQGSHRDLWDRVSEDTLRALREPDLPESLIHLVRSVDRGHDLPSSAAPLSALASALAASSAASAPSAALLPSALSPPAPAAPFAADGAPASADSAEAAERTPLAAPDDPEEPAEGAAVAARRERRRARLTAQRTRGAAPQPPQPPPPQQPPTPITAAAEAFDPKLVRDLLLRDFLG
jgi:hypothetical protein